jgi:hypothetical protein
MQADQHLTVAQVCERWGKSDTTVRRHLTAGKLPNALPPDGARDAWAIPEADVVALYGPAPAPADVLDEVVVLRAQLDETRAELTAARHDLDVAMARLDERERADETLAVLRQALPVLTALAARAEQSPAALTITASEPQEQERRRWWNRRT